MNKPHLHSHECPDCRENYDCILPECFDSPEAGQCQECFEDIRVALVDNEKRVRMEG